MSEYNREFYDDQEAASLESARVVINLLFARFRPMSVLDVGCGLGTWLRACVERGVGDVTGIDGTHIARTRLHIPPERFLARDLSRPLEVGRRFDLVLSLEVAEHLASQRADSFIGELTALSDVVLFSAALPYQGGTGHVNENWAEYWSDKFRRCGFSLVDLLRPALWNDERVAFWYRQNLFLYVREQRLGALDMVAWQPGDMPLSAIHPEMFLWACARARRYGNAFDRDRAYWRHAAHAYRDRQVVAEAEVGYGGQYRVRFDDIGVFRRLKRLVQ